MPPRRSARVAAVVERQNSALPQLPLDFVLAVFSLLPVETRLRCLEVCRGWRAVLRERSLWTRLELRGSATETLLRAAAARAGGQLHTLVISGSALISYEALLAVVTANAGALRELRALQSGRFLPPAAPETLEALLRAAPRLHALHVNTTVQCRSVADAQRLLSGAGAHAPLRLVSLEVKLGAPPPVEAVVALAAAARRHAPLTWVKLEHVPLDAAAALDAVVDAALAMRLEKLKLSRCSLSPASAPALARLLRGAALTKLHVHGHWVSEASAAVVAPALQANTTLTTLSLDRVRLWLEPAAAVAILTALTGHGSLRELRLANNGALLAGEAATALGALVAANARALRALDVTGYEVSEAGLRPLLDALPLNKHIRKLTYDGGLLSEGFCRQRLLPAVRGNRSLRELQTHTFSGPAELEAKEIVGRRAARAAEQRRQRHASRTP
jgi:hypothetical protein